IHDRAKFSGVCNVAYHQFETIRKAFITGREIVVDDGLMSLLPKHTRRVAADITGTADYQNFHSDCWVIRRVSVALSEAKEHSRSSSICYREKFAGSDALNFAGNKVQFETSLR